MESIKLTDTRTRQVINKNNKKAFDFFAAKQYKKAFGFFAHNLSLEPNNTESTIGVLLSDMAQDFEEQALGLYEYYQILLSNLKNQNKNLKIILGSIDEILRTSFPFVKKQNQMS